MQGLSGVLGLKLKFRDRFGKGFYREVLGAPGTGKGGTISWRPKPKSNEKFSSLKRHGFVTKCQFGRALDLSKFRCVFCECFRGLVSYIHSHFVSRELWVFVQLFLISAAHIDKTFAEKIVGNHSGLSKSSGSDIRSTGDLGVVEVHPLLRESWVIGPDLRAARSNLGPMSSGGLYF